MDVDPTAPARRAGARGRPVASPSAEHRRLCLALANSVSQARLLEARTASHSGRAGWGGRLASLEAVFRAAAVAPTSELLSAAPGRALRGWLNDLREADVLAKTLANRWYAPTPLDSGLTHEAPGSSADYAARKRLNLRLNDLEILRGRTALASNPTVLYPDISGACNLKCPTCPCHGPEGGHPSLRGVASPEVLRRLCSPFATAGSVGIYGSGEPLLSPHIGPVVRAAIACGCAVELATNGTVPERVIEVLPQSPLLTVVVSCDGATPETFEALRRGARFTDVVAGIRAIRRRRPEMSLAFNCTVSRANLLEIPSLVELAAELGVGSVRLSPLRDFQASRYYRRFALRPRDLASCARAVQVASRRAQESGVALMDTSREVGPIREGYFAWLLRRARSRRADAGRSAQRPSDDEILAHLERLAARSLELPPRPGEVPVPQPLDSPSRHPQTLEQLASAVAELERQVKHRTTTPTIPHCLAPFRVAVPQAGGGISPCCVITDHYGDFSDRAFEEAWNSPDYQALRHSMLTSEGLPTPCTTCRDPMRVMRLDSLVGTLSALGVRASPATPPHQVGRRNALLRFISRTPEAPCLYELGPRPVEVGTPFNVQPDGRSAIWVRSRAATPASVLFLDGHPLETSVGEDGALVTAFVPAELQRTAGDFPLYLHDLRADRRSNVLDFQVREPAAAAAQELLRVACWFGSESPLNFWSSDLSGAREDFGRLRGDGFNGVMLLVPWAEFQPGIRPVRFDARMIDRLARLLDLAAAEGLRVVLRLGFLWDYADSAELPGLERFERLYCDQLVLDAWIAFLGRIREVALASPADCLALISWEDLWFPVLHRYPTWPREKRLAFLRDCGFGSFVHGTYGPEEIARLGGPVAAATPVPEPPPDRPSFRLWLDFLDHTLSHRFHGSARSAWPGISCEIRTDWDSISEPDGTRGWHDHAPLYRLPGAVATGYFSTSMGAANSGDRQTAQSALERLRRLLENAREKSGRRLFLAQLSFVENAPGFEGNTAFCAGETERFIELAANPLGALSAGYGIWTYRDYAANLVFNPAFALGLDGWVASGDVSLTDGGRGGPRARLAAGSTLRQEIPLGRDFYREANPEVTFEMELEGAGDDAAAFAIRIGGETKAVSWAPPDRLLRLHLAKPAIDPYAIEVRVLSQSPVQLRSIRLFSFVQQAGIYRRDGSEGPMCAAIRRLNALLSDR